MKELHTKKPLLLGIIGLPGAGKTKFAGEFSVMFGAPVIDLNLLRHTIFENRPVGKQDEEGIKRLFWLLAEDMAKTKRTFVVDGNFSTYASRNEVQALAKKHGYDVLWLWVQTSISVAKDRATRAKKNAPNTMITPQAFDTAAKKFEPPRSSEQHIVTSGQRTFTSQVRPILARLAEDHESQLHAPRAVERDTPKTGREVQKPDRGTPERPTRRNIFIR